MIFDKTWQHINEEQRRLDEWGKRLDKKKDILSRLKILIDILPNNAERAEEIIKNLDNIIERYK
jgi:hypothetical protein